MRKLLLTLSAVFAAAAIHCQAQLGSIQAGFEKLTGTNAAVDFEALRGLKGNKYIFAATYVYNITTNAAVLVSYDQGYTRDKVIDARSTAMLKGGLALSQSIAPFKAWFGLTNFIVNIGAYEEAGAETSGPNTGQAVNVAGGYIDTQFHVYKALYFHVGALYQNRTQEGTFGGNYAGVRAAIGGKF